MLCPGLSVITISECYVSAWKEKAASSSSVSLLLLLLYQLIIQSLAICHWRDCAKSWGECWNDLYALSFRSFYPHSQDPCVQFWLSHKEQWDFQTCHLDFQGLRRNRTGSSHGTLCSMAGRHTGGTRTSKSRASCVTNSTSPSLTIRQPGMCCLHRKNWAS
jgi:hypothetical protein